MPSLNDILTGFDSVQPEGAAFIAYASAATSFSLVDLEHLVVVGPIVSAERMDVAIDTAWRTGGAVGMLWKRRDGSFGALVTIGAVAAHDGETTGTLITRDGDGFQLMTSGAHEEPRPVAAFAVAADPYVAADFCRTAAISVATAMGSVIPSAGEMTFSLAGDSAERAGAVYSAAVAGIWSRSVKLVARSEKLVARSVKLVDGPTENGQSTFDHAAARLFDSAPTITRDRLFTDCRREPRLLKAFIHRGRNGVLGLFNCNAPEAGVTNADAHSSGSMITDTWRVDDVEGLGGDQFAAWHAVERKLFIIDRGVEETVDMPLFGAELIHLVPILQNVAPLGLIDRLNATAFMTRVGSRKCKLADGGTIGWYAGVKPSRVLLDGESVAFEYSQASGLVSFLAEAGRPHDAEVVL